MSEDRHQLIASLHHLQQMQAELLENSSDDEVSRRFHPSAHSLGWYLGRAVYIETHLLRELMFGEDDLTSRVRSIFAEQYQPETTLADKIPSREHLLNWALEIREHNLALLANPSELPDHPLLHDEWLLKYLVQENARIYDRMLNVLLERSQQHQYPDYEPSGVLVPQMPEMDAEQISQGHYRIGAGTEEVVFDNEYPRQIVELQSFRISRLPVTNANYLAFMLADGYENRDYWSDAGFAWLGEVNPHAPRHWHHSRQGNWFAIGLNGAVDLVPDDPVYGVSLHEAQAYANWAGSLEGFEGAALQHEFQWEVSARQGVLDQTGRVFEWCRNPFEAYEGYERPDIDVITTEEFDRGKVSVRGACIHTQPQLRRASYRGCDDPINKSNINGIRLVFPSLHEE